MQCIGRWASKQWLTNGCTHDACGQPAVYSASEIGKCINLYTICVPDFLTQALCMLSASVEAAVWVRQPRSTAGRPTTVTPVKCQQYKSTYCMPSAHVTLPHPPLTHVIRWCLKSCKPGLACCIHGCTQSLCSFVYTVCWQTSTAMHKALACITWSVPFSKLGRAPVTVR